MYERTNDPIHADSIRVTYTPKRPIKPQPSGRGGWILGILSWYGVYPCTLYYPLTTMPRTGRTQRSHAPVARKGRTHRSHTKVARTGRTQRSRAQVARKGRTHRSHTKVARTGRVGRGAKSQGGSHRVTFGFINQVANNDGRGPYKLCSIDIDGTRQSAYLSFQQGTYRLYRPCEDPKLLRRHDEAQAAMKQAEAEVKAVEEAKAAADAQAAAEVQAVEEDQEAQVDQEAERAREGHAKRPSSWCLALRRPSR